MRILVVEDNDIKFSHIEKCLDEARFTLGVERACSYQSGLRTLIGSPRYDLIVLDMTLNNYDVHHGAASVPTLPFGGELILREVKRRSIVSRFVVLTQYDVFPRGTASVSFQELRSELLAKYPDLVAGVIKMDTGSEVWRQELLTLVNAV